jgi:hypothetical protein
MKMEKGSTIQDGNTFYLVDKIGTKYIYLKPYQEARDGENKGKITFVGYYIQELKKDFEFEGEIGRG